MTSINAPKPAQQIGLGFAVAIGLASMLGAGVFVVFHEADVLTAKVSDHWALLIAIGLAGMVASLNAASVYQLAKQVSRAGGVYAYSRVYVGPTTSFIAGFSFIFGKIGSIAAIALVFGVYVWPEQPVLAAVSAIVVLTAINLLGINRTAKVALGLAISTVSFLLVTIFWGLFTASKRCRLVARLWVALALARARAPRLCMPNLMFTTFIRCSTLWRPAT